MSWRPYGNASFVRMIIRMRLELDIKACNLGIDISTDEQLKLHLEDQYHKYKWRERIVTGAIAGDPESAHVVNNESLCAHSQSLEYCLQVIRQELNQAAEGLFAFGHVQVYPDIIN